MSSEPSDPTRPASLPGFSAATVPGTETAAPSAGVWADPTPPPLPGEPPAPAAPFAAATAAPMHFQAAPHPGYAPPDPAGAAPPGYAPGYGPPPGYAYPAPPPGYAPAPGYGPPPAYEYAAAAPPYAPPPPYGAPPSPYAPPPPGFAAPHPGYAPPPPGAELPLADRIPGAVEHDSYTDPRFTRFQAPTDADGNPIDEPPSAKGKPNMLNGPAIGLLTLIVLAFFAVIYPQYTARHTEHEIKPLVAALSNKPGDYAHCPRYITSVFTYVGVVTMDAKGNLRDHTDLTGPICKGLRHLYSPGGRAEMRCLTTDGHCSQGAMNSVIALSTVTHESMHLRGILDEAGAECASVGDATRAALLAGLTADEGRMIGYLHLMALNPDTPPQYHLSASNCAAAADLLADPPGTPELRASLVPQASRTWRDIASG